MPEPEVFHPSDQEIGQPQKQEPGQIPAAVVATELRQEAELLNSEADRDPDPHTAAENIALASYATERASELEKNDIGGQPQGVPPLEEANAQPKEQAAEPAALPEDLSQAEGSSAGDTTEHPEKPAEQSPVTEDVNEPDVTSKDKHTGGDGPDLDELHEHVHVKREAEGAEQSADSVEQPVTEGEARSAEQGLSPEAKARVREILDEKGRLCSREGKLDEELSRVLLNS